MIQLGYLVLIAANAYGLPEKAASPQLFTTFMNIFFGILGAICVLTITLAGLQMIIADNDPQKIAQSRRAIYYSIIGLLVAIFAATFVNYVLKSVA